MSQSTLFGCPEQYEPERKTGHAGKPGRGPEGETCGTCGQRRRVRTRGDSVFQKCWLCYDQWTGGGGTDIRCKDPACEYWEKEKGDD